MWGLGSSIILNTDGDHNFISSLYQRKQIIIWDDSVDLKLQPILMQFFCFLSLFFIFWQNAHLYESRKKMSYFLMDKGYKFRNFVYFEDMYNLYIFIKYWYIFFVDCDKGFRFPLSVMVFELKLDCSKTGAGGRCNLLAVVIT